MCAGDEVAMKPEAAEIPRSEEKPEDPDLSDKDELSFVDDVEEDPEEEYTSTEIDAADDMDDGDVDTEPEASDNADFSSQPIRSRQQLAQIVEYYGYPRALGMQIWDEGVRVMMESNANSFASTSREGEGSAANIANLERRIDIMTNLPLDVREELKRKFFN